MSGKICLRLRQITHILGRRIENNLSKSNIDTGTMSNGKILLFIHHVNTTGRDVFSKDLEKHFCVTRSSMSKVISLMVKKELLNLEKVDYDARLKKLVLTNKAKALIENFKPIIDETESIISQALNEKEIQELEKCLNKILDYLRENKNKQEDFLDD